MQRIKCNWDTHRVIVWINTDWFEAFGLQWLWRQAGSSTSLSWVTCLSVQQIYPREKGVNSLQDHLLKIPIQTEPISHVSLSHSQAPPAHVNSQFALATVIISPGDWENNQALSSQNNRPMSLMECMGGAHKQYLIVVCYLLFSASIFRRFICRCFIDNDGFEMRVNSSLLKKNPVVVNIEVDVYLRYRV